MSDKCKNIAVTAVFLAFLCGFYLLKLIVPSGDYSFTERRKLNTCPEFSAYNIFAGKISDDFEKYAADHFPLRDQLRQVKAFTAYSVLMQKDVSGYYVENGYASKLMFPINTASLDYATSVFDRINEMHLKDKAENVYLSIVPDKNYFLAKANGYPSVDYDAMAEYVCGKMPYATYIPLYGNGESLLSLSDYYYTDTHWRQERIVAVADKLAEGMGISRGASYETKKLDIPFYGVYFGQAALSCPPEDIYYLTNEMLENCTVYDYEADKTIGVYNPDKAVYDQNNAVATDAYEYFLSGARSMLRIENPGCPDGKRLIVFRDSFGSSLIPLLCESYSEIMVLDVRYVASNILDRWVDFEGADVLFLYSTLILNDSTQLR